jgi:hypothetical protein
MNVALFLYLAASNPRKVCACHPNKNWKNYKTNNTLSYKVIYSVYWVLSVSHIAFRRF